MTTNKQQDGKPAEHMTWRHDGSLTTNTEVQQGGELPQDDLVSKDNFYSDPIEDIAHALAQELEDAELDPNDFVTVNRAKLSAIAGRVLEKARAALAQRAASVPAQLVQPFDPLKLRLLTAGECAAGCPVFLAADVRAMAARSAPVPAAGVQGDIVIGFPDPEAVFAIFCDREGFPSDGDMDEALRKAFYEGTKLGHPAPSILPDSGRDAALEIKTYSERASDANLMVRSKEHLFKFALQEIMDLRAALAAHPAPSSDAATMREQFEADVRAKCHSKENADEMLEMNANGFYNVQRVQYMWIGWQAAHPANGAQAGPVLRELTPEEIQAIENRFNWHNARSCGTHIRFARAYLEAASAPQKKEG